MNKKTGIVLVALSAASFGVMPVFIRGAYASGASVYTTLFLRFAIAAFIIFPLLLIMKKPMPSKKKIVSFFLLGAVFYVAQSLFYYLALTYTTASVVALLLYTYPAFVVALSVLVLKEKVTAVKIVALVLALSGAMVVSLGELDANLLGVGLALLSAVSYTIYILINSRVVEEGEGLQATAFIILGSAVVFGITTAFVGFEPPSGTVGWASMVAIAVVSTVFAFWAFLTGLEMVGASSTAIVSTLDPVVAVLCSVLFLSESLSLNIVVGGCLVLAALLLTARFGD